MVTFNDPLTVGLDIPQVWDLHLWQKSKHMLEELGRMFLLKQDKNLGKFTTAVAYVSATPKLWLH